MYIAPEVYNKEDYDARADLWSIGVMLFQLATGRLPEADKVIDTAFTLMQEQLSDELQDLIPKLIQVDPDKRLTVAQFLAHPFISGFIPEKAELAALQHTNK